jgi:2-(1,2-epoxy-1,2-dihydrophenyl)acetyl-CoA isomerase
MFTITDEGPLRRLTIDNRERRNAIPREGWRELARHFAEFEDSNARVLVLSGAGGDFCSGADLGGDLGDASSTATRYRWMSDVGAAAGRLHELTKPTLAAVDGVAVGAGMNLAIGCDVVVCADRARFSEIFVKRGLAVDFGGTWLLPRLIGLAKAKELALTGRIIGADEAFALGLVSRVVAPADLDAAATEIAGELAAGAPLAQQLIKAGFDRSLGMDFDEALDYESKAQVLCFGTEDVIEGVSAFLQKRPPDFKGR